MTKIPTDAYDFVKFMEMVWACEMKSRPDGGVDLYGSPLYNNYHNAVMTARRAGFVRTGGAARIGGESWIVMRHPDHKMTEGIRVAAHGGAVVPTYHRFGHHKKSA
jgi:hypothetical protein